MKKRISLAFLLITLACRVYAQGFKTGGELRFFAHPNLNEPHVWERLGSSIQLRLKGSLTEYSAFFTAINFNYELSDSLEKVTVYPMESYVDLFLFENLDIRIGNQFIFWGKADWINPTDNINPWDYQNISGNVQDYRIPVTAVKLDYYLSDYTSFEFVWLPIPKHNLVSMEFPRHAGSLTMITENAVEPVKKLSNSEFAVKFSSSLTPVDFSFSWFHGFDKNPSVFVGFLPSQRSAPVISFTPHYDKRIDILGGDFITTFDKFAFKGEAAYYKTEDKNGKNIFVANKHLKYVLGIDYYFSSELTFNFQFIQDIKFNFDAEYEKSERIKYGEPIEILPRKTNESVSTRIKYSLSDFTDFQFISVFNLRDKDYFLLPVLTHEISDGVNIYLGGTIFGGDEYTVFGKNKKFSRAFIELKYCF